MGVTSEKPSPHAQPLFRPQLDEALRSLERKDQELVKLKRTVASVVAERDGAIDRGKQAAHIVTIKYEAVAKLERELEREREEREADRKAAETVQRRLDLALRDLGAMRARVTTLEAEVRQLSLLNAAADEKRIKAEQAVGDSAVDVMRAQSETRKAQAVAAQSDEARQHSDSTTARLLADKQEREAAAAAEEATAEVARRALLDARMNVVAADTRQAIDAQLAALHQMGPRESEALAAPFHEAAHIWRWLEPRTYNGAEYAFPRDDAPIVLLSANWLRTQRPACLPERQKIPAEALLPLGALKAMHNTIGGGKGGKPPPRKGGELPTPPNNAPLPIVCVIHPRMGSALAADGAQHPDEHGSLLELLVKTLDARWSEFTTRRNGKSRIEPTGVTDLGILLEWSSLYMQPLDAAGRCPKSKQRTSHQRAVFAEALEGLHTFYASVLTTVWMVMPPPAAGAPTVTDLVAGGGSATTSAAAEPSAAAGPIAEQPLPSEASVYTEAWPAYLHSLATTAKPSSLAAAASPWPQLLEIHQAPTGAGGGAGASAGVGGGSVMAEVGGSSWALTQLPGAVCESEKVGRPPPAEPLAFHKGHLYGHLAGAGSAMLRLQLQAVSCALLGGLEELDFRRCGWGDSEACRLAVVLPLCARLKRLMLSSNRIGSVGAAALATALGHSTLSTLELLALDNNAIGDAGAAALFQRMTPTEDAEANLAKLKTLTLANNELSDAAVLGLMGNVTGGALYSCSKLDLEGNPVSKASLGALKKAHKKAKKGPAPTFPLKVEAPAAASPGAAAGGAKAKPT